MPNSHAPLHSRITKKVLVISTNRVRQWPEKEKEKKKKEKKKEIKEKRAINSIIKFTTSI